jgi:hypothetical protein
MDLLKCKDFIPFGPVKFEGYEAIGFFPYEKAQLSNNHACVPMSVYKSTIDLIPSRMMDNKVVILFKDTRRFNTDSFAMQIKDGWVKIGKWNDVVGYALRELK